MIDPVTALSIAASCVSNIKTLMAAGHDASRQLASFAGAFSDIQKAEEKIKNPPWYQAIGGTDEGKAAQIFAARKKMEQMKAEIEQTIQLVHGPRGLNEYKRIVRETRELREKQVYRQQKIKESLISAALATIIVIVGTGVIGLALYFMFKDQF